MCDMLCVNFDESLVPGWGYLSSACFCVKNSKSSPTQHYDFQAKKVHEIRQWQAFVNISILKLVHHRPCLTEPLKSVLTLQLIYNILASHLKWWQSDKSEFDINFNTELSIIKTFQMHPRYHNPPPTNHQLTLNWRECCKQILYPLVLKNTQLPISWTVVKKFKILRNLSLHFCVHL